MRGTDDDQSTMFSCVSPEARVPALFVAVNILSAFGQATSLDATPMLARYCQAIQKDEHCGRVYEEMAEGFKAFQESVDGASNARRRFA